MCRFTSFFESVEESVSTSSGEDRREHRGSVANVVSVYNVDRKSVDVRVDWETLVCWLIVDWSGDFPFGYVRTLHVVSVLGTVHSSGVERSNSYSADWRSAAVSFPLMWWIWDTSDIRAHEPFENRTRCICWWAANRDETAWSRRTNERTFRNDNFGALKNERQQRVKWRRKRIFSCKEDSVQQLLEKCRSSKENCVSETVTEHFTSSNGNVARSRDLANNLQCQ